MLKLQDAFTLAWTKLLSRKLWTALFLIVEILLLSGVLILASSLRGFETSLARFNSEGLNGKYLVTASNVRNNPELEKDPALWDLADKLYQQAITEHSAIADRLNLEYSAESEIAPTEYVDGKRELIPYSPYAKQAMDIMMQDYLVATKSDLEKILQDYDYSQIFTQQQLIANGNVVNLEDGVENLRRYNSSTDNMQLQIFNGLYVLDETLYQDYLFENLQPDPTAIPVVLSVDQAETLLGTSPINSASSNEEKIQHFEQLQAAASGLIVESCYRNSASQSLIFTASQILDEIERNKDKPYYQEPTVIYNLPTIPCGATTIQKDTRTDAEKQHDVLQLEYQKATGSYEEPVEKLLKFQIIGLIPTATDSGHTNDIFSMIQSLGGVSIATPLISQSYYDAHAEDLSNVFIEPDVSMSYLGLDTQYIIEFDNANTARSFINEQSCQVKGSITYGCATAEHLFLLSADNNNSLIIEDISHMFSKFLIIIVLIVLIITVIFFALMVIRSITNDRKEIAIFRAIGFRRPHILQIYLFYSLVLSGIVITGASILSLTVGFALSPWLSDELTNFLRATFLTLNPSITASLFTPHLPDYLYLNSALIIVSLCSTLVPTLLKSRQSIIDGLKFE